MGKGVTRDRVLNIHTVNAAPGGGLAPGWEREGGRAGGGRGNVGLPDVGKGW